MRFFSAIALLAAAGTTVPDTTAAASFVPICHPTTTSVASSPAINTCLHAIRPNHGSRRDYLNLFTGMAIAAATATTTVGAPAYADFDFDRVQDLLKEAPMAEYQPTTKRPTYLTEPTEEFKQNEKKASEFRREQLKAKQNFQKILTKLQEDPNDEELLAGDLDELRRLVRAEGGLPLGITKDEVVTQVRRRKSKRYWPVNCEIAYQDLLAEIALQQSPNKDKEGYL